MLDLSSTVATKLLLIEMHFSCAMTSIYQDGLRQRECRELCIWGQSNNLVFGGPKSRTDKAEMLWRREASFIDSKPFGAQHIGGMPCRPDFMFAIP